MLERFCLLLLQYLIVTHILIGQLKSHAHAGKENTPFHLSNGKACLQKMVDSVMVELSS